MVFGFMIECEKRFFNSAVKNWFLLYGNRHVTCLDTGHTCLKFLSHHMTRAFIYLFGCSDITVKQHKVRGQVLKEAFICMCVLGQKSL